MTDQQILEFVKLAQSGDQTAFTRLYDEFADRIYRYVRFKIANASEAEDIFQDVFVKAWIAIPKLRIDDLKFSAWLYKIATNTINDIYRKKYRSPCEVEISEVINLSSSENIPDQTDQKIETEFLKNALTHLDDKYRQILELKFVQDFTTSEIAKILSTNTVTVRVWQHRAIKQLEQVYKKYERID